MITGVSLTIYRGVSRDQLYNYNKSLNSFSNIFVILYLFLRLAYKVPYLYV